MSDPLLNANEIGGGSGFSGDFLLSFTDAFFVQTAGQGLGVNNFSITVPATEIWEILYFHATIACSATVANRCPWLRTTTPGGTAHITIPTQYNGQWVAGVTERAAWILGRNRDEGTNAPMGPTTPTAIYSDCSCLPPKLLVEPTFHFFMQVDNFQAGDQISDIRIHYRKFLASAQKLGLL